MKTLLAIALPFLFAATAAAQQADSLVAAAAARYVATYTPPDSSYRPAGRMQADSVRTDSAAQRIIVYTNEPFSSQPFTPAAVSRLYNGLRQSLPEPYSRYALTVADRNGLPVEALVPNVCRTPQDADPTRLWSNDNRYTGRAWVSNTSRPYTLTHGLAGRHLMVWPSHGRYFKQAADTWTWQRPRLYATTEDLLTQSVVFPYLFPMLQNAGAIVVCPRERDPQPNEAVVDNDSFGRQGSYAEHFAPGHAGWHTSGPGFALPDSLLTDSLQPFRLGTARAATTTPDAPTATAEWTPRLPEDGAYAVYVSYASLPNSIADARYTVFHKGGSTQFEVNQQMGGGTWVYLGTFDFSAGENPDGRVVLTNQSSSQGCVVSADGVRFGGGRGHTLRGGRTSALPRHQEAARYYAQWAGLPDSLYATEPAGNDYNDDLRVRANMLNFLASGSPYVPRPTFSASPDSTRQAVQPRVGVPLELSLAIHSDAGVRADRTPFGTLAICTPVKPTGEDAFPSQLSRYASHDLAALVQTDVVRSLSAFTQATWPRRELWHRNYAETRLPDVPSAIIETLSHQNYADMRLAHDPHFKFALARAIYKGVLRFVSGQHGEAAPTVQPLPVRQFAALLRNDSVCLSWLPTPDTLEASAVPTDYVVYTAVGQGSFDNGQLTGGQTSLMLPVAPGQLLSFRVTALNAGGESFPSETLSVCRARGEAQGSVLVVNGFDRLSGPARVEQADSLGFNLQADVGVPYGSTTAFVGYQHTFDKPRADINSGAELQGVTICGNTFDYPRLHAEALLADGRCNVSSASWEAAATLPWADYAFVDYLCGLQQDVPHNLRPCKAFPPAIRQRMDSFGGSLLVSGAYIGRDMPTAEEQDFCRQTLHYTFGGTHATAADTLSGLNLPIPLQTGFSPRHYALQSCDVLLPEGKAFTAFAYPDGTSAGIAWRSASRAVIATGFPWSSIDSDDLRRKAMGAFVSFLLQKP